MTAKKSSGTAAATASSSSTKSRAGSVRGEKAKRKSDGSFDNAQRATEPKTDATEERKIALPSQGGPQLINGHHPACYIEDPDKPRVSRDLEGNVIGEPCPNGCGPAEG